MCETCGCGDPELVPVEIQESILAGNDRVARHNREHFDAAGTLAINLMGSPGSGKTALLEATARALSTSAGIAAITGDLATDNDARRLRAAGIPCRAVTTGSACHLDARIVHDVLHELAPSPHLLFIENVGNLVCPAIYDLGQHANVVVLSVTEGMDKPLKYPVMFREADLVVVSKTDLLPVLEDISVAGIRESVERVMPRPAILAVSARRGEGIGEWIHWLETLRERVEPDGHGGPHPHHHHPAHDHGVVTP
jgi:hydrogenase nickel incorporation protein HypB